MASLPQMHLPRQVIRQVFVTAWCLKNKVKKSEFSKKLIQLHGDQICVSELLEHRFPCPSSIKEQEVSDLKNVSLLEIAQEDFCSTAWSWMKGRGWPHLIRHSRTIYMCVAPQQQQFVWKVTLWIHTFFFIMVTNDSLNLPTCPLVMTRLNSGHVS